MIVGIGCDVIEIQRVREALQRHGRSLIQRLFTPQEIAYCEKNKDPMPCFAGRFAAKEALAKALGVGIGSRLSWKSMEIIPDERGRPLVEWHIDVEKQYGVTRTHVSISHSKTVAMAHVVLEG